jgi:aryl-alcohol dehydrogenase-like predicted oxidoreductase
VRTLGNTGLEVSMLSFGGGSQFLKNKDGEWEPLLERAVEEGINFFDTCSNYQWGASLTGEERFGEILPRYRNKIIISTKFDSRDPAKAMKEFDQSLKRMKTEYVDILMIHSIEPTEDVATIEKGVYREMLKLKEQGAARFLGFSSMNSASRSKEVIEKLDLDVALIALNPTKYGKFSQLALPAARKRGMGVLAMKVVRDLVGKHATARELFHYAWGQEGVATALVGHHGMKPLEENVRMVKAYFAEEEKVAFSRDALEHRLAHLAGPQGLCWARSDYFDGRIC